MIRIVVVSVVAVVVTLFNILLNLSNLSIVLARVENTMQCVLQFAFSSSVLQFFSSSSKLKVNSPRSENILMDINIKSKCTFHFYCQVCGSKI